MLIPHALSVLVVVGVKCAVYAYLPLTVRSSVQFKSFANLLDKLLTLHHWLYENQVPLNFVFSVANTWINQRHSFCMHIIHVPYSVNGIKFILALHNIVEIDVKTYFYKNFRCVKKNLTNYSVDGGYWRQCQTTIFLPLNSPGFFLIICYKMNAFACMPWSQIFGFMFLSSNAAITTIFLFQNFYVKQEIMQILISWTAWKNTWKSLKEISFKLQLLVKEREPFSFANQPNKLISLVRITSLITIEDIQWVPYSKNIFC